MEAEGQAATPPAGLAQPPLCPVGRAPPTPHLGLDDVPGVPKPQVVLCVVQQQAFFQVLLGILVHLPVAADRQDGWNQAATRSGQLGLLATTLSDWGRALGLGSAGSVGVGAKHRVGSCSQL